MDLTKEEIEALIWAALKAARNPATCSEETALVLLIAIGKLEAK